VPSSPDSARLTFGIYPGSAAGSDTGEVVSGPPDDPARIVSALEELQGRDRHPLVVRAYRVFADADDRDRRPPAENPLAPVRYTGQGRSLDLVVQYQSRRGDTAGYCSFLRSVVAEHGPVISTLQVGSAPSRCGSPSTGGPPAPAGHRNGRPCLFHQFGLMTDDYTPKPAFHAYRELIGALSPGAEGRRGRPGSRPGTGTPPPTRP
jgi:hypothetical protein